MTPFKKVAGANLLILLIYTVVIHNSVSVHDKQFEIMILMVYAVGLQVIINFITAIIFYFMKMEDFGRAFLSSSGLVLLIGFSTCFGSASF